MIKTLNHSLQTLVILMLFSFSAGATLIIPSKATLRETGGTPVAVGDGSSISAPTDGSIYVDQTKKGLITLAVDHHYPTAVAEGTTTVELEVTTYNAVGGSPNTPFTITLEVDYTPNSTLTFNDRQIHELNGILAYDIEILTINGSGSGTLPLNLYIDAELFIDRVYDFSDILDDQVDIEDIDPSKILDHDCDDVKDNLLVRWDPIKEADEYQLEWSYVNDYTDVEGTYAAASDVAFDFRFNSSRITTTDYEYAIPLTYDHGYVVYRVRAVGRLMADPTKRQYSLWSMSQKGFVDPDAAADYYHIEDAWEISKNWQYSVTFAEEGKKKEVVSFFDGSLRNRQMVTLISTNNKAIVGETIYDHQGRPAIQVLPTPVSQPDCTDGNNTLKYYPDFNKSNLADQAYSRADFDISDSSTICDLSAGTMSTSSGASNYYSSSNPETTGAQGYLPDAAGFPFSQVEYTPDNTGRIRRQGGVGETFQLGNDHESKYFYGHPAQVELDRLFGSEVGYASHYQKNMVVDPNGQVSVSYLDQEGRVIATALAGNNPDNLIALESLDSAALTITDNILTALDTTANTTSSDGLSKTVNETVLISSTTNVVINYSEEIAKFTDSCLAENICFGCVYDLTINFKNECGVSLIDSSSIHTLVGHFSRVGENDSIVFSMNCTSDSASNLPFSDTLLNVPIGNYQLTKTLALNTAALDFYEQRYLNDTVNTCFKTLEDFREEYLANADFSGCDIDTSCAQCLENLPSLEDFLAGDYGTEDDYQLLLDNCSALCEPVSMYESFRGFLLMDMNPGGQYGEYLMPNGTIHPENFALSVYNTDNKLPRSYYSGALGAGIADWQRPVWERNGILDDNYYDENLATVSQIAIEVTRDGTGAISATNPAVTDTSLIYLSDGYYTVANNLANVEDFIANFQPSWSNSLIYYHPEYRILKTYRQMTLQDVNEVSSESFDALMEQADTWQAAIDAGLIRSDYDDPLVTVLYEDYTDVSTSHAYDPFLVELLEDTVKWTHYKDLLISKMGNYQTVGSSKSMAEIAAMMARCGMPIGSSPTSSCFQFGYDDGGSTKGGTDPEDIAARNADWVNFRSLYRSLKQQYISQLSLERSIEASNYYGYNGCIGNSNFNPFLGGFFGAFPGGQYINNDQPCFVDNAPLYAGKAKRFVLPSDVAGNGDGYNYSESWDDLISDDQYLQYVNTGECPVSIGFAGFINDLAGTGNLTNNSYDLALNHGFTGLAAAYYGISNPSTPLPSLFWSGGIANDSTLIAEIIDSVGTFLSFEFYMHQDSLISWDSISSITDVQALGTGGILGFTFTGKAVYVHGDTTDYYPIFGTTNLDILHCSFPDVCQRNDLGDHLLDLFHSIASSGHLTPGSAYTLKGSGSDPVIESFVTTDLVNALAGTGAAPGTVYWLYNTSLPGFIISSGTSGSSPSLIVEITNYATVSAALPAVSGFSNLIVTGSNTFTLNGTDSTGALIAAIECTATTDHIPGESPGVLTVGSCGQPQSGCTDLASVNFNEFSDLLTDVLLHQTPDYDLTASSYLTENLLGQMDSLTTSTDSFTLEYSDGLTITPITFDHQTQMPLGDGILTETYYQEITSDSVFVYKDSIYCAEGLAGWTCDSTRITFGDPRPAPVKVNHTTVHFGPDCDLTLSLGENPITGYNLSDITSIVSFEVTGEPDLNGNYHAFNIIVELDSSVTDTVRGEICLPIRPCTEITTTFHGAEPFPEVVITDPCVAIVTNLAYAAAEDAYNAYADSLKTDFRARYVQHCMSTVEEFSRTYDQKEYHFTLYYYDQAGNLVKTVPPEGVEQLEITSGTDDLALTVASDRTNGTHTVITNHRMQTLYSYNSLNQLVAQHMPDQDDISSWNQTQTNGLDMQLHTTAIQMLSASVGYLTGYVNSADAPTGSRGYLYKTTDGGNNWSRMTNLFPFDLVQVKMASSTEGFAVGKSGVALKTVDGGTTWDLMNMHSVGVVGDFVGVGAEDADNAAFLLSNGHLVPLISGTLGTEYTPSDPTIPYATPGVTLRAGNSITYNDHSNEYAVNLEFVTGTSPDTLRFTQMAVVNISAPSTTYEKIINPELDCISYSSGSLGVIGSADGDLIFLSEVGSGGRGTQFMQSSNNTNQISDVAFLDQQTGVALAYDGTDTYCYQTTDHGMNWTKVSTTPALSMTVVSQNSTELYVAASYSDATVEYYQITNSATTLLWTNPSGGAFSTLTSYLSGSDYYLIGSDGLNLVKSGGFIQNPTSTPSFSSYYTFTTGFAPVRLKAIEISGTIHVAAVRKVSGTYIVDDAYKIGAASVAKVTISPSSTDFRDIAIGSNGGDYLLGYEANNLKIHRMALSSSAPSSGSLTAINASTSTLPSGSSFSAMALHGNYITLIGTGIYSDTVGVSATSTANLLWRDRSDLRLQPIRSIAMIEFPSSSPDYNAVAVGERAITLQRSTANVWEVVPLGISTIITTFSGTAPATPRLNSVAAVTISSNPYAIFAGDWAFAKTWDLDAGTLTTIGTEGFVSSSAPTFYGVAINDNKKAVITSGNNKAYYCSDFTATSPTSTAISTGTGILYSASFPASSNTAIVAGEGGRIGSVSSSTFTPLNGVYGPRLNSVHFASTNIGTVAGDNFFVRSTANGGASWNRVLPSSVNSTSLTQLVNKVWTRATTGSAHYAVLGGIGYLAYSYANVATPDGSYTPSIVTAIQFSETSPNTGYFADGATLKKMVLSASGSSYSTTLSDPLSGDMSTTINAIQVLNNGSHTSELLLVGNNMIQYKAEEATSTISLLGGIAGNIRDVAFADREHGYVVGDNGLFYKIEGVSYNSLGTAYTAMSWVQKDVHDTYSGTIDNINLTAVEFPSASQGIWGGSYASSPGFSYAAVRVLHIHDQNYSSRFYYDRLGRIVVSQNSRQEAQGKYSYTLYDALGRVYEAGEKTENTEGGGALAFMDIFGTSIGGQYVSSVIDDSKLQSWITTQSTTTRKEVTKSYYDRTNIAINASGVGADHAFNLATQRKRIVHVTYEAVYDDSDGTYDHATHYDYDIHGNVKTLLQDNPKLGALADLSQHRFKQFDYVYDLISGNVHRVDYQSGEADQWHHAYQYDADNRITEVYTTTKTPLTVAAKGIPEVMMEPTISTYWTKEAEYQYYDHGPLARTVIGEHEVQGVDYVYTLQGWIKSVNSNNLNNTNDPGQDAAGLSANHAVAGDVMGYSLHYYNGDYSSITSSNGFAADQSGSDLTANSTDLYNGNIGKMVTTITHPDTRAILPLGTAYKYDQLNRLKEAVSFTNLSDNSWGSGQSGIYGNSFTYDANGNILQQTRKDENGDKIDSLSYRYHQNSAGKTIRNRLYTVNDVVSNGDYADDIDDMGTFTEGATINTDNNYVYDAEGRLIKDLQEEINIIGWRVDGKVQSITRTHGSSKKNIIFEYDAMGHRIAKHIYNNDNVLEKSTYYMLDAQGNTMATYERVNDPVEMEITFNQTEKHIYGSSRLGVMNDSVPMLGIQNNHTIVDRALPMDTLILNSSAADDSLCITDAVGKWFLEIGGSSGTISDNIATFTGHNSSINFMTAQVTAAVVPGETYTLNFDVSEKTNLSYMHCEVRMCESGPPYYSLTYLLPTGDESQQITFTVPGGASDKIRIKWFTYEDDSSIPMGFSLSSISLDGAGVQFSNDSEFMEDSVWTDVVGKRNYELTNHLGNVLSVISDKPLPVKTGKPVIYENSFDNIPENFIYENDFSSSLDGFYAVNGASTASLSSGRMEVSADLYGQVRIDLPTTVGHKYIVSYDYDLDSTGITYARAAETVSGTVLFQQYQEYDGHYNFLFEATTTSTTFYFYVQYSPLALPNIFYLDDFSVNDVTGEATYEPFYGSYSVSLSVEGNRMKAENVGQWTQPQMNFTATVGNTYKVTCDMDLNSGGNLTFFAFDNAGGSLGSENVYANGTHSITFTATTATTGIAFQSGVAAVRTYYIDNFKIEDITDTTGVSGYLADIRQSGDYSPFGVQLSGRNFIASSVSKKYRMGYQGSEMDNEVKGSGNSYTTEFRQLDPRLGRWLTIDPKMSAWESPYASMGNNPILYNDPMGDRIKLQEKGEHKRELRRMIREARKQSEEFNEWYKSKRFDGKKNFMSLYEGKKLTSRFIPTNFTAPLVITSTTLDRGEITYIGPEGSETCGTSCEEIDQAHYYFPQLIRNTTTTDKQSTGNPIALSSDFDIAGFKYDKQTGSYSGKIELKEKLFQIQGHFNPLPEDSRGTVVRFDITDGANNPVGTINVLDQNKNGGKTYFGPMLFNSNDKTINITVTVTNPITTSVMSWKVSTTTTTPGTSDTWGFDVRRLFRREKLKNL